MLPLKYFNPTRRLAVLTIALIAINALVFLYQWQKADDASLGGRTAFACEFGVVPNHLIHGEDPLAAGPSSGAAQVTCQGINQENPAWITVLTSMFLHGGWLHLLGNMLFLWIFGNNVEDRLGRLRFIPFYLICGTVAALTQALGDSNSDIPLIGASGAISGILGAYLLLYPRAMVLTLILPIFLVPIPAWLMLGIYFLLQFVYLGGEATVGGGGVAYLAHIGGFVAGIALIKPFLYGRPEPPEPPPRTVGPVY